ncbi:MAG TPA: c-type cytochrome [Candidatus Dormibacteraeota bacterium]|nr:c-type cytochrome [Candidatus Dormibacteraeota bacterium]
MRLKTLGVFLVTAMAFFTALYWLTDTSRRDAVFATQEEELLAFGEQIFGPDTLFVEVTMTAGAIEPAEVEIPVNGTVRFVNETGQEVEVTGGGAGAFELPVNADADATHRFTTEGTIPVTSSAGGALSVRVGPEALSEAAANCARCHGATGMGGEIGNTGRQAPNLHSVSIANKLRVNDQYVRLVISFGGVVVSGDVNSPMPAWSTEVGGPLTVEQIDALTALVVSWATEAASQSQPPVSNTPEDGAQVYTSAGCGGCHGSDLAGTDIAPGLLNIGNEPVTDDLPTPISQLDKLVADYEADPGNMLELWIRDSAGNYNDGAATGMPPHPEGILSEDALQALITFLLTQQQ